MARRPWRHSVSAKPAPVSEKLPPVWGVRVDPSGRWSASLSASKLLLGTVSALTADRRLKRKLRSSTMPSAKDFFVASPWAGLVSEIQGMGLSVECYHQREASKARVSVGSPTRLATRHFESCHQP